MRRTHSALIKAFAPRSAGICVLKHGEKFGNLFPKLYGGGGYWSLTSEAVGCLVRTIRERHLMNYMRHTHCAEEVLFHTILLNVEPRFPVIPDSKRYSKWEGDARSPKVLDESDFEEVMASGCFFARKFELGVSKGLMNKIKTHVSNN